MLKLAEKQVYAAAAASAGLADFDVEQCVEDMFRPWLIAAPGQAQMTRREEMESRASENPMIATRPSGAASSLSLPPKLREELLELVTEILLATKSQNLQTLMLCGVEAGVGASFIASHLSHLLAEFKPLRIAFLTVVSTPTYEVSRTGRCALPRSLWRRDCEYLLFRTQRPNLMEVAFVQGPVTLMDLLSGAVASVALPALKREFDFIILDTPAVTSHAEVALLAALVEGVILVAEPHVSSLRSIEQAYHRLRQAQANVLGMVLNRQKRI